MMDSFTTSTLSPQARKIISEAPLFLGVEMSFLDEALSSSRMVSLKRGEVLLETNQPNSDVCLVLSGRLSVQFSKELDVNPIAMFGEGECVGEMSVLGDGVASAFVVAATDCELLAIDHSSIWRLIDNSHKVAHNMLHILSQRIRHTDRLLSENLEQDNGYTGMDMVDELTGLYNQQWLLTKFGRYWQRCVTNKKPCFLILLEMDGYEDYVRTHGSLGGDQALRAIAGTISACLRPDDLAGHHSGAIFSICLPNSTSLEDTHTAAERLRVAVNQAMVFLPTGDMLPCTSASQGISQARSTDDLADIFSRAEDALGAAKNNGGNCVKDLT